MLSVVVPFYNGEKWLPSLLQSLAISIARTNEDFSIETIIVIDSEKTSLTTIEQLAKQHLHPCGIQYRIIKNTTNLGVARSRDAGMALATGDYITFIDQDDYVSEHYCNVLNDALHAVADVYLLNGIIRNMLSGKQLPVYYRMQRPHLKQLIYGNNILSPSFWVVRTEFLRNNGIHFTLPFDDFQGVDDWYYSLQIFFHSSVKLVLIKVPLIYYCLHETNYSHNLQMQFDGSIAVLKSLQHTSCPTTSKWINARIRTFEFAKRFYLENKMFAVWQQPWLFMQFLYHYTFDPNRLIRFLHRSLIGMKIR